MAKLNVPILSLNAGEISNEALARIDLEKMSLAGERIENIIPTVLGPGQFRPGTKYITNSHSNKTAIFLPFVFSSTQTALLELTEDGMRVIRNDEVVTRSSVSTTITNGNFSSALGTGWTDQDETGCVSAVVSTKLEMTGTQFNSAKVRNAVTVSGANDEIEHGVKINIEQGSVKFRIGTTAGDDDIFSTTTLEEGDHSLGFTPGNGNSTIYIELEKEGNQTCVIDYVTIESAGEMLIPHAWDEADLEYIRYDQSADVIFVALKGYQQYKIERRGWTSWSIVKYLSTNGPWLNANTGPSKIEADGRTGDVSLTASKPVFKSGHVGALLKITHLGMHQSEQFTGESQFTDPIRVNGVDGADRGFTLTLSNLTSTSTTVTLQRSYDDPGDWTNYKTYTTNQSSITIDDSPGSGATSGENNDNQVIYYRLAILPGDYSSGTITATLNYDGGAQTGICRITSVADSTNATAEVIQRFSRVDEGSNDWAFQAWSDVAGWPSAVALFDGRLWWAGTDKLYGSVSDNYYSFDPDTEGDSGPINRSIATGPVEGIHWVLPLQRIIVGTAAFEVSVRSSSFDEPLTPTNFTARNCSTRGCANIDAVTVDSGGIFVQRNGRKAYEIRYDIEQNDYDSSEVTRINQEILDPGIKQIVVQRHPDTRVWFVKDDGTIAVLVYERSEGVIGWCRITLPGGEAESIAVIPDETSDEIYVLVKRTIDSSTVRYIEKFAVETESIGGTLSYNSDCSIAFDLGSPGTAVTGLDHLEGEDVVVWADGSAMVNIDNALTVSGGQITLPSSATEGVVGLPYYGYYKSVKLAYGAQMGTALLQRKALSTLGVLLRNSCTCGVKIGQDFTNMTMLSRTYKGKPITPGISIDDYDFDATHLRSDWDTDRRFCLRLESPFPTTVLGFVVGLKTNDRG
jgi:hypothetical protein